MNRAIEAADEIRCPPIAGISGQTPDGGVAIFINSDGELGTVTSSAQLTWRMVDE
jgi:hypothetical protein